MTDGDRPADEERSLWALSRDEQRLLLVTLVGGLASIVVGAGAIGGAIALARMWGGSPDAWRIVGLDTAAAVVANAFVFWRWRRIKLNERRLRLARVTIGVEVTILCYLILVWVGVAPGIK